MNVCSVSLSSRVANSPVSRNSRNIITRTRSELNKLFDLPKRGKKCESVLLTVIYGYLTVDNRGFTAGRSDDSRDVYDLSLCCECVRLGFYNKLGIFFFARVWRK